MKFSLKWLGDFIEVEPFFKDPQVLLRGLTQAGLEFDFFEEEKKRFENCVVAQITSAKKHPQADRLKICEVVAGEKTYSVVCGAKNYKEGDKVILAKPGAVLAGDLVIKKSRIRGIVSEGMLASRSELGFLSKDKEKSDLDLKGVKSSGKEEGLWVLPFDTVVGTRLSEYLSFEDVIFDLSVPPNRPDCLSHKGLAREIHCLLGVPLVKVGSSVRERPLKKGGEKPVTRGFFIQGNKALSVKKTLKVEVKNDKACPRYCGRLITGLKIGESPAWLKSRLHSLGLKSINNVVDITNFVLWDRGQPLHAFDRDKIRALTVDLSKKAEKFLSLDGQKFVLSGEELTIRDGDKILALAGVIGGMDSSVTKETTSVFIESASFSPEKIRRATRRLGIDTHSSYRFARGTDVNSVKEAMDLACFLIQKLAGGQISGDYYDVYKCKTQTPSIKIDLKGLENRIGYKVSPFEFKSWMEKAQCKVNPIEDIFEISPPSYRQDLQIKEDVIEEFARLKGYYKVPENPAPSVFCSGDSDPLFFKSQEAIRFLSGKGWYQALNYSFCDPDYYKDFLTNLAFLENLTSLSSEKNHQSPASLSSGYKKVFFVDNPISRNLSLMKPLLIPDLMKNVVYNFRRNNKFGQIFELSPVFYQQGVDNYKQELCLGLALWGKPIDIWTNQTALNVYYIKTILEGLFKSLRLKSFLWKTAEVSFLHPHQSLGLMAHGQVIGVLGSLHPRLNKKYKIPLDIALAEIRMETLEKLEKKPLKFKPFSKLLGLERDLCFLIPKDISVEDVRKMMKKSLGAFCENIEVFDVYEKLKDHQKKEFGSGDRSVSFRINLAPREKSWTDKELQVILTKLVQGVCKTFSIHFYT